MAEERTSKQQTYVIPNNYTDSGRIFGGMFSLRNVIEAAAAAVILYGLEKLFVSGFVSDVALLIIMLVTIAPAAVICLIGIGGDPITIFLKAFISFMRNKRKMRFRKIYKEREKEE